MKTKRLIFGVVAASIPLILILLLETGLRLSGVNPAAYRQFVDVPGVENHIALNPEYVQRYFREFKPAVPFNPFRKQKPDDSIRIFVVGGSSTAGFPYQFYHGFPAQLASQVENTGEFAIVEVINLGMTAVNSYTLWDLRKSIADQNPDAVIVYAGHNEFYGAFGTASNINSAVNWIWLKRLTLRLKKSVIYSAMESAFQSAAGRDAEETERTLMARVVRDSGIARDSDVFSDALDQFQANMSDFVRTFSRRQIPVFIGTVTSNLADQSPLSDNAQALEYFQLAGETSDAAEARNLFVQARDHDEIRFRAPSEINNIIRQFPESFDLYVVDVEHAFQDASSSGIEGDSLFTDHLHPNYRGYGLLARTFFDALAEHFEWNVDAFSKPFIEPDAVDKATAQLQVDRLRSSYPFVKGFTQDQENAMFQDVVNRRLSAGSFADSTAVRIVSGQTVMTAALNDAIARFGGARDTLETLRLLRSQLFWKPTDTALQNRAIQYAIGNPKFDEPVGRIASMVAHRTNNQQALNSLAAIHIRQGNLSTAEKLLERAEENEADDPVTLFNRARLLVLRGDTVEARKYFERYRAAQP